MADNATLALNSGLCFFRVFFFISFAFLVGSKLHLSPCSEFRGPLQVMNKKVLVFLAVVCACSSSPKGKSPQTDGGDARFIDSTSSATMCSPPCRQGYLCSAGLCVSCCNPICGQSEMCVCVGGNCGANCGGSWTCQREETGSPDALSDAVVSADTDATADSPIPPPKSDTGVSSGSPDALSDAVVSADTDATADSPIPPPRSDTGVSSC